MANSDKDEPKEHEEEFGEEFDFESDEHDDLLTTSESIGETETPVEAMPKQRNVVLPLLIGLAIIGFIGWKVFGMLSSSKETQEKGPPKEAPITEVKTAPKIEPAPAPIAEGFPKTTIPDVAQAQEQAKFASSEEKIAANLQKRIDQQLLAQKQQFEAMQKELVNSTQNLGATNKIISNMQNELSTLSASVQELSAQVSAVRQEQINAQAKEAQRVKKAAKPKKISPKSEAYSSPTYSIHAIIPGRAWLRTREGKTITITEGDSVGEYGKVLKIDAPNGIVITTSGVTLR
ncbi:MAG: hypothetical protein JSS07_03320 [Proteobacteria bacterium]|nr:hypothetical protein [Pseudomonadota bacterium]